MSERARGRRERVDAWLAAGGVVLAANERAARSVTAAFQEARRAEGLTAWLTPAIFAWDSWVRERWQEWNAENEQGLMVLNRMQEQSVWMRVILASKQGRDLLHPHRLAGAAQQAHRLLCGYAPEMLMRSQRAGWLGDAAIFSEWLTEFDVRCKREAWVSGNRISLDLTERLRGAVGTIPDGRDKPGRSALLLIGFDWLLKPQRALLDVWGEWVQHKSGEPASTGEFYESDDGASELSACVRWLHQRLEAKPETRLMVIATGLEARRGELERALLSAGHSSDRRLDFEFSLGVPLGRMGLVRCAVLLLRWLHEPLSEPEVDWLIGCGHLVASENEELALAAAMRALRSCGWERPHWTLAEFAACAEDRNPGIAGWAARMTAARERLQLTGARMSPLEWVGVVGELLEMAGWPGFRPASSLAFQARRRWETVLEDCGSLGFDGSQLDWAGFVAEVSAAVSETIFAVESREAPIQVTGPLESAGQLADGIWFLGADEEGWPGRGQPHSLLPISLQREAGMPHASQQGDWVVAREATLRLRSSADEVVFSYARQGATEARASRLVGQLLGHPRVLPTEDGGNVARKPLTEVFEDFSQIRFPLAVIGGGAGTLTRQSLCPFQAFATARLGAQDWEPAEAGLNAKERGQLLHGVLQRVWAGRAKGALASLEDLMGVADLPAFVRGMVRLEMGERFGAGARVRFARRFPERYLTLEARRLTRLVTEWLGYERGRLPFTVLDTEVDAKVQVAGLSLKLRMDRVDQLQDGSRLIVDYKSSVLGPKAWDGERPDDVQLPLYATFTDESKLGGLAIGRVRPGEARFLGRVRDAEGTLLAGLSAHNGLVKHPLDDAQLEDWRERIERLGEDFLAGRAQVNPKDGAKTCENCHLHAVCRIYENRSGVPIEDEEADEDANGEDGGADGGS